MTARVTIAALVLVLAGAAESDARTSVKASFEIPTVDGQEIDVTANERKTTISADVDNEKELRYELAEYDVESEAQGRGVHADFGRFGAIDMSFRRRTVHRSEQFGCTVTRSTGVFIGTASYAGEGLLAGASVNRAPGRLTSAKGPGCHVVKRRERGDSRPVALTAFRHSSQGDVPFGFSAIRQPDSRDALFTAVKFDAEGPVSIFRVVYLFGSKADFHFSPELDHAKASPPAPFAGTATFERSGDQRLWTGDLTVSFLGLEPEPLTGPGIRANLHRIPSISIGERAPAQLARYAGK